MKYHVVILQHPAPLNDLGEMTETELYGCLGLKLGEAAAELLQEAIVRDGFADHMEIIQFGREFAAEFVEEVLQKDHVALRLLGLRRLSRH